MGERTKEVLIVDDNFYIRAALRTFIEESTTMHVCGEAADGTEAIEKAKQQRPTLILMDFLMPKMNGAEAASVIRTALPQARIVMFTLYPDAMGKAMAKAVGADLVVSKSVGAAELMDSLRLLLSQPFDQVN